MNNPILDMDNFKNISNVFDILSSEELSDYVSEHSTDVNKFASSVRFASIEINETVSIDDVELLNTKVEKFNGNLEKVIDKFMKGTGCTVEVAQYIVSTLFFNKAYLTYIKSKSA